MADPLKPDDEIEALLDELESWHRSGRHGFNEAEYLHCEACELHSDLRSANAALRRERDEAMARADRFCTQSGLYAIEKLELECAALRERAREAATPRLRARIASKLAAVSEYATLSRSEVLELVDDCCAAMHEEVKSDPRREFTSAMNWLVGAISGPVDHDVPLWDKHLRRACIAFADALCDDYCMRATSSKRQLDPAEHEECRAALLREVGLEECGGG